MKTIQSAIALSLIAIFGICFASSFMLVSCSKTDDNSGAKTVFPEENFLQSFLTITNFNQQISNQSVTSYQNFGITFKPQVNGTINSIVLKLPQSDGNVIIRIWKVSTQALLKTFPVVAAANNIEVTTTIDKIPLLKDEEYIITMKVKSWFYRKRTNSSNVSYPVLVNNINIINVVNFNIDTFPSASLNNYYAGDISFNFQQTE